MQLNDLYLFIARVTEKFSAVRKDIAELQARPVLDQNEIAAAVMAQLPEPPKDGVSPDPAAIAATVLEQVQMQMPKEGSSPDASLIIEAVLAQIKLPKPAPPPTAAAVAALMAAAEPGPPGPMPDHRWDGTKLAFEKPDGGFGKAVDLKGEPGKGGGAILIEGNGTGGESGAGINDEEIGLTTTWSSQQIVTALSEVSSGLVVKDSRKLAKWFAGGVTGKTIGWIGDSTTWQMGLGQQNLTANNGPGEFIATTYPSLANIVERNFGNNGAFFSGFIVPGGGVNTLDEVAAAELDVAIVCYGINDFRGGLAPGAPGVPDYRVGYGQPGNVAAALLCQTWMVETIVRLRAANPDICIIFRMPNGAAVSNQNLANGVSSQNMMDVLRLAYRGDASLNVPNPETFSEGVLVYDVMGTIFGETAFQSTAPLLDDDGLHPNSLTYRSIIFGIAGVLEGPPLAAIGSAKDARQAQYRELAIAHGHAVTDPLIFTESGEWYRVYDGKVQGDLNFYWDLGLGPTSKSVDHAWGAGDAAHSSVNPAGLVYGDRVLWNNGDIETVAMFATNNPGVYRYNNNEISGSEFLPGYQQGDGIGKSKHGTGSKMTVYRHIYANSLAARRNAWLKSNGTPEQQTSVAYKYAYRITSVENNNGSIKILGVGGEVAANGKTGSAITPTVNDVLCMPGLEGGPNAPIDVHLGIPLTGATFAKNNNEITITLAGRDFRAYVAREGFLLSNAEA